MRGRAIIICIYPRGLLWLNSMAAIVSAVAICAVRRVCVGRPMET